MGFFKKLFGDAADELKKNLEDAKNEMLSNLEEVKQDVMGGFTDRTSNSRDDDEEDDEEPVLEPKPEPEAETKVEVEQKEEPIENGGLFSARLEAMIAAALQDGVLTDKERELLKRRVEKEGEDWDEVEMIIEARLAEMKIVAPAAQTIAENASTVKDTWRTVNVTEQTTSAETLHAAITEEIRVYREKKLEDFEYAKIHKKDSIEAKKHWKKAVSEIKTIDAAISNGARTVKELKLAIEKAAAEKVAEENRISAKKAAAKKAAEEKETKEKAKERYKELSNYKSRQSNVDSVKVPEGVLGLGYLAFYDFKMKEVSLPSTLRVIRDRAFCYCNNLKNIYIPDSVEIIEQNAFTNCQEVKTIVMPASLKELHTPFCGGMDQLTKVDFSKVTQLNIISKSFICGCKKLRELVIPQGAFEIQHDAFSELDSLKMLYFPPSLTKVGDFNCDKMSIYCYSPHLDELEPLVFGWENKDIAIDFYVLPQYLDSYIAQRNAERIPENVLSMQAIPDEYLYYYDN